MKTKEFIKIIEDAGFEVEVGNLHIRIKQSEYGFTMVLAIVSRGKRFGLGTQYDAFNRQSSEAKAFILDNLYKYSSTPIAEREDKKVIELNKYERMILESLHRDYVSINRSARGRVHVSDANFFENRNLDMFEELFSWVELDKQYRIKDLLNAE